MFYQYRFICLNEVMLIRNMNEQTDRRTNRVIPVFCLGFKNEGTFVPSPLKMKGHFQNLWDILLFTIVD